MCNRSAVISVPPTKYGERRTVNLGVDRPGA
jgi:hypothetical protein